MTNEHNIESQFNACMHKEYCLSLKAGQVRPLDENALAHTINMMPWRTDELGPQLREFAEQLWTQFCSVPAAAPAPAATEPFGYFRAEPFGWTDCAATDEGAIALYERPSEPATVPLTDEQIKALVMSWAHDYGKTTADLIRSVEAHHGICRDGREAKP